MSRVLSQHLNTGLHHGLRSWDGWVFSLEARPSEEEWVRIEMNRDEALRHRRQLDLYLKATAPPRKKAGR